MDPNNLPLAVVASREIESCAPQSLASLGVGCAEPHPACAQLQVGTCAPLNPRPPQRPDHHQAHPAGRR